jgi:hypothetical protein
MTGNAPSSLITNSKLSTKRSTSSITLSKLLRSLSQFLCVIDGGKERERERLSHILSVNNLKKKSEIDGHSQFQKQKEERNG